MKGFPCRLQLSYTNDSNIVVAVVVVIAIGILIVFASCVCFPLLDVEYYRCCGGGCGCDWFVKYCRNRPESTSTRQPKSESESKRDHLTLPHLTAAQRTATVRESSPSIRIQYHTLTISVSISPIAGGSFVVRVMRCSSLVGW